jgi:hypothetical protein
MRFASILGSFTFIDRCPSGHWGYYFVIPETWKANDATGSWHGSGSATSVPFGPEVAEAVSSPASARSSQCHQESILRLLDSLEIRGEFLGAGGSRVFSNYSFSFCADG